MHSKKQETMGNTLEAGHTPSETVPEGYKRTEMGVIPEEWTTHHLSDDISLFSGHHVLASNYNIRGDGIPYVTGPADFPDGQIKQTKFTTKPTTICRAGDILVTVKGSGSGTLVEADAEYCISRQLMAIRTTAWNPIFLMYSLLQNASSLKAASTGLIPGLSRSDILDQAIPLPKNTAEQHAIAEALSDVDGLLTALDELIAKKRAIKQAAMQQLLTGKTRLPGFGRAWETKRVSEFGDIVTGATPRTDIDAFWGEQYPWITPTDISFQRDMISSERMITQEGLNSIKTLPANCVLVTCIASIGKNAILKTKGCCNQQINAVIPNAAHSAEFLYYLFELNTRYLLAKAGITATSIVSKKIFGELSFKIPFVDEQRAIATVLSEMDAEIVALEQRRDKARAIKQGMMQQLLTGRIRLIQPEVAVKQTVMNDLTINLKYKE